MLYQVSIQIKTLVLLLFIFLLSGCASPYLHNHSQNQCCCSNEISDFLEKDLPVGCELKKTTAKTARIAVDALWYLEREGFEIDCDIWDKAVENLDEAADNCRLICQEFYNLCPSKSFTPERCRK